MKIVACYKCVPNTDNIHVNPDRTINLNGVDWEIGQYDLSAIEEATKLAAATGGAAIALTAGGEIVSNSKLKKAAILPLRFSGAYLTTMQRSSKG